jgi:hypothetical protein
MEASIEFAKTPQACSKFEMSIHMNQHRAAGIDRFTQTMAMEAASCPLARYGCAVKLRDSQHVADHLDKDARAHTELLLRELDVRIRRFFLACHDLEI